MTDSIENNERYDNGFTTASGTVSQGDHDLPGGTRTGQEENGLRWVQHHVPADEPEHLAVQPVIRMTELLGGPVGAGPDVMRKMRERTGKSLQDPAGTGAVTGKLAVHNPCRRHAA